MPRKAVVKTMPKKALVITMPAKAVVLRHAFPRCEDTAAVFPLSLFIHLRRILRQVVVIGLQCLWCLPFKTIYCLQKISAFQAPLFLEWVAGCLTTYSTFASQSHVHPRLIRINDTVCLVSPWRDSLACCLLELWLLLTCGKNNGLHYILLSSTSSNPSSIQCTIRPKSNKKQKRLIIAVY